MRYTTQMEGLLYDSHASSLTGWTEAGGEAEGVGTDGEGVLRQLWEVHWLQSLKA